MPAGRFLVACSSDDGDMSGSMPDPTPPAAAPTTDGTNVIYSSSMTNSHFHTFGVAATDISSTATPVDGNTSTVGSHDHTVSISSAELDDVAAGQSVKVVTGTTEGHSHTLTLVKLGTTQSVVDAGSGGGGGGGAGGGGGGTYSY